MKGRKPKPTKMKLLAGNPGKRPINDHEPSYVPFSSLGEPPPELDQIAKEEWMYIVPLLTESGVLTAIDKTAITAYCMLFSRWIQAEAEIRKSGCVSKGSTGSLVISPWVRIASKAVEEMRSLMSEFGMTPVARSRINVASTRTVEDELDRALFG